MAYAKGQQNYFWSWAPFWFLHLQCVKPLSYSSVDDLQVRQLTGKCLFLVISKWRNYWSREKVNDPVSLSKKKYSRKFSQVSLKEAAVQISEPSKLLQSSPDRVRIPQSHSIVSPRASKGKGVVDICVPNLIWRLMMWP